MNMIPHDLPGAEIEVENGCEWIDGEILEKDMGMDSSLIATNLIEVLSPHVKRNGLGRVFPGDLGYQIKVGSSRRVRKPDVSFIPSDKGDPVRIHRGNARVAPALAVEIVSLNDKASDIEQRVADFMSVGTRLFWVIHPATRSVWVLRADGTARRLTEPQELSGEDVVPGFACPVATLFEGLPETPSAE